jgi:hypothetical protein
MDCNMNVNTPSSSRFGLSSGTTADDGVARDSAFASSNDLSQEVEA